MRKNTTKEKLKQGQPVIGVFCNIGAPVLVEMLGALGYDFVILDAEHGPQGVETVEHMVRAADAVGVTTVTRIAVNLPQNLLRYLDAVSLGVQIPMVNTGEQAQQVVDSVKYPPVGKRGLAGVRANLFGLERPLTEYVRMANEETLVVVQVETTQAMQNIKKISAVDNVDVVFIGPTDLSSSMGYPGQPTHPEVLQAIEDLGKEIIAAGKAVGTIAADATAYRRWRDLGFQYLCTGITGFVVQAGRAYLEGVRQQEQERLE